MPMYDLVPVDSEARNLPPRDPVNVPDQMVNQPRSKTSLFQSFNDAEKKNNSDLRCDICDKTYKNKNSLGVHNRRYHSKLPLRLFLIERKRNFHLRVKMIVSVIKVMVR